MRTPIGRSPSAPARSKLLLAAPVAAALLFTPSAHASSVLEFPDNGSEQMARGGAWIARASDPLAAFYNPAGLAGQQTGLTLQANISIAHRCFRRTYAQSDTTLDPLAGAATGNYAYPKVCAEDTPFPNPQIGFNWRLTDKIGLGLVLLGPSAVGKAKWPEFVDNKPSPQRYLLIDADLLFLTPTIGAGFEVADNIRIGASFQWGIAARVHFSNASMAVNQNTSDPTTNDVRAQIDAKQIFVPGFTLGGLWSATDNIDLAAWYKWSAPIDAKGDVTTYVPYFTNKVANGDLHGVQMGDSSLPNCGDPNVKDNRCGNGDNGNIKVNIPMEAKLGVRYHQPRAGAPQKKHVRDPMSQDLYDVELNLTWANNSVFDNVTLRFPADANGNGIIPIHGITGGTVPPNADVAHNFKDVFGVRVGGDYNVLPDQLAIRGGAFFETRAQDPQYQNIDLMGAERFGLALGGTYRLRMGPEKKNALEFSLGYGHIFVGTLSNNQVNGQGIPALAGTPCVNGQPANGQCTNTNGTTTQAYRSIWPVNLGTITNSINVINVGATYRF